MEDTTAANWAQKQHTGSPAEKAVLLILALEWDKFGSCKLSAKKIAQRSDTDPATAERICERLRDRGLIWWTTGSGRAPNSYALSGVESLRSSR